MDKLTTSWKVIGIRTRPEAKIESQSEIKRGKSDSLKEGIRSDRIKIAGLVSEEKGTRLIAG